VTWDKALYKCQLRKEIIKTIHAFTFLKRCLVLINLGEETININIFKTVHNTKAINKINKSNIGITQKIGVISLIN